MQPERDNPLMRRCFREVGLPGKQPAKRCGVAYSQIYMARTYNVGADNAQKISRTIALILRLSERDRLELKAEIMVRLGEFVCAWFGNPTTARHLPDVHRRVAAEIVDEEKSIAHRSGLWALEKQRMIGAPEIVIESIEMRLSTSVARSRFSGSLRSKA